MNDDVCQCVAVGGADQIFEAMSTPINQLLNMTLRLLDDCEDGRGKNLEEGFLLQMEKLKKTSATAALQHDAKGRLN